MNIARELIKIAKLLNASTAEKAVEELLHDLLNNESTFAHFRNNIYGVGGYVRDKLWGIDSDDLDLIVNLKSGKGSEKLTKLLFDYFGNNKVSRPIQQRNYPIWKMSFKDNIEYKGKIYNTKGADIDFADPQKESFPDENTRQRETLPGTLQEDAERRDLTINTLMQNLTNKEIVDLTGYGLKDIQEGVVRISPTVDWNKILSDDPLRLIRVVRFFLTKSNLKSLQKDMLFALKHNADRLAIVSPERITKELEKIMKAGKLSEAISLFNITGILPYILPELEILKDTHHDTTRGIHQESSVWNHMLLVLKNAPATIEGQLAALLHDIGKPQTREELTDKGTFYGHEDIGGELAEAILRRLKFDNQTVSKVRNIVEQHMAPHRLQEALESTNNEKNQ
jgi:putative nucleotidyltransferase with HDIG domain